MEVKTERFFEVKVESLDQFGKKHTDALAIGAISFTEAETKATEYAAPLHENFRVVSESIASYGEVAFDFDNEDADTWFKVKLGYITIDEMTQKEKMSSQYMLVQAENFESARKAVNEIMYGSLMDWKILRIEETKIIDVLTSI